ncbi:hypothetical protein AGDE_09869 [Angomonas deanei]|nr:hypothetical protein AGDE_09869 [Angomonas deanei]|eukprot:EPY29742.1 hypothetical protein AGDE_09869 [Angomonas deanei]
MRRAYAAPVVSALNTSLAMSTSETLSKKSAMRKEGMKKLREYAKTNPTAQVADSEKISQHLFDLVRRHTSRDTVLHCCAYLPLPYEVDLRPFMKKVLAYNTQDDKEGTIKLYVPVVLTPPAAGSDTTLPWHVPVETAPQRLQSAMLFVELFNLEEDLAQNFERHGRFNILELKQSVLEGFFQAEKEERALLTCDAWSSLFPSHAPPASLTTLREEPLLVVTPGVCFDAKGGARLGKGGGYYDRFLQYHRAGRPDARTTAVAVGFPFQLVEEAIPMTPALDAFMDSLVTPEGVVNREGVA